MNYQEAASQPLSTKVEVPCFQCGSPIKTSPRYIRQKLKKAPDGSLVACLSCHNRNRAPEVRAKIGESLGKTLSSDEQKARMSAENRRRLDAGWKPANNLPGDRGVLSDLSKRAWEDPEYREKQKAGAAAVRTPEWKEKMSEVQKSVWSPELRERQRLRSLEIWDRDGELYRRLAALHGWNDLEKLAAKKQRKRELHKNWVAQNRGRLQQYRRDYVNPDPRAHVAVAHRKRDLRSVRKDFVVWLLGGACQCGCTKQEFLHLHHVGGDGKAHRDERSTSDMWKWAFSNPQEARERLSLLCANCHCVHHSAGEIGIRRKKLLFAYGGKCALCLESRLECLQFDHIDPDCDERPTYKDITANPDKYRVLCANCNHARGRLTTNLYSRILSSITDKNLDIPSGDWGLIKNLFDKEQIAYTFGRVISEGRIALPAVTLSDGEKLLEVHRLTQSKGGSDTTLSRSYSGQKLSSHFTDAVRFKTVGKSYSAVEIWNDRKLATELAKGLFIWGSAEGVTNQNFRRYLTSKARIPSQFRPAAALDLIRRVGAKSFYDPCGGWADRLLAALVSCDRVHVNDVNQSLAAAYRNMTDWASLHGLTPIVEVTVEDAATFRPVGRFDLSFTSPPYFDSELYERDNPLQSHHRGRTEAEWASNFLLPVWHSMRAVSKVVALNIPEHYGKYLPTSDDRLEYEERRMVGASGSDPVFIWST